MQEGNEDFWGTGGEKLYFCGKAQKRRAVKSSSWVLSLFEVVVALEEEVVVGVALDVDGFDAVVDEFAELVDVRLLAGADEDGVLVELGHPGAAELVEGDVLAGGRKEVILGLWRVGEGVNLVEDNDLLGAVVRNKLVDGLLDDLILLLEVRVGDVHHMNQQVGFAHLVQRRFERLDKMMRELADKTDGVGEQERQIVDSDLADGGIERGKELVLGKDVGFAHEVHERGFADVGISDECDTHHLAAVLALGSHLTVDALEVFAEQGDAVVDDSAVSLNLRLTRTAVGAATTALTVEVRPHTCQAREHVLQMRHLNLRLGVGGLCALEENLQNKDGAIHDADRLLVFAVKGFLDVAELAGGEFVVEDNELYGLPLRLA